MAIDGAYRRWLYPSFSTPRVPEVTVPEIILPIEVPTPRRKPGTFTPFEQARLPIAGTPPWVQPPWEYPRGKQWLHTEFEKARYPLPKIVPTFVQTKWEYPHGKPWPRPGLGKLVDIAREVALDLQWNVPLSEPVRSPVWIPFVPIVEPPPPREQPKPPYYQWHITRRIPHALPPTWQPWVPTGGGFGYFTPVSWEYPKINPRIIEPFGLLDFTARDFIHGIHNWSPPPINPPPPPRPISPVPYIPIVVPDDLYVKYVPNCPRPLRRPDTKC